MRWCLGCLAAFLSFFLISSTSTAQVKCEAVYGDGSGKFSLATGSPGELGLLKALGEAFAARNGAALCWVKAGSGESLKLLKERAVDMIAVHAPADEKKAVQEGWGTHRTLIGSNEFFIVGPPDDPAKIAEAGSAVDAYTRIARARSKFFSRGDNSGTHQKEMSVWKQAGITPSGDWYIVTREFMTATLLRTDKERGYFMTDSSTWVAEGNKVPGLKILFKGDKFLVNTYHTLCVPAGSTPGAALAEQFIRFVGSEEGQKIMREYGKDQFGQGIYNDAAYAAKYDD